MAHSIRLRLIFKAVPYSGLGSRYCFRKLLDLNSAQSYIASKAFIPLRNMALSVSQFGTTVSLQLRQVRYPPPRRQRRKYKPRQYESRVKRRRLRGCNPHEEPPRGPRRQRPPARVSRNREGITASRSRRDSGKAVPREISGDTVKVASTMSTASVSLNRASHVTDVFARRFFVADMRRLAPP